MPFPNIDPAIETFLEPTRIFLFGKQFPTLRYHAAPMNVVGTEEFERQPADAPRPGRTGPGPRRGRRNLRAYLRLLVRGSLLQDAAPGPLPRPRRGPVAQPGAQRGCRRTGFSTRFTGVEARDWQFGSDIRVWAVDKHDIAVCLDIEIGSYDQVLLQPLAAAHDEGAARNTAGFRGKVVDAAGFRGKIIGAHQDR